MEQAPIKSLLESKVDRKQFLQRVGAGAVIALGASRIADSLKAVQKRTSGYGSGDYSNR